VADGAGSPPKAERERLAIPLSRFDRLPWAMAAAAFATGALAVFGLLPTAWTCGIRAVTQVAQLLHSAPANPINSLVLLVVVLLLGGATFALRQRARDVYSILEVIFGILTASAFLTQLAVSVDGKQEATQLLSGQATAAFSFIAGLYVVVRGMDNLDKCVTALPKERRLRRYWERLFVCR